MTSSGSSPLDAVRRLPGPDDGLMRRMAAGLLAMRDQTSCFGEHFGRAESEWKHDGTRVTHADRAISKALFDELRRRFPDDEFFSEETEEGTAPQALQARFAWVADPIDGTNNYALGIPVCAISLALLENGTPVCGFIYDYGLRVLLHGGPGLGLFADGSPVARLASTGGRERVIAMHSPIDDRNMALVQQVIRGYKLRAFGSGALHLAYVAMGRIDACIDLTVKVWDIAAAWAFCQVTGVEVRFLDGPLFPLKVFDAHSPPLRYVAGAADLIADLAALTSTARPGGG